MSDAEADADVNDPNTATQREHIRRDVHVKVAQINIGAQWDRDCILVKVISTSGVITLVFLPSITLISSLASCSINGIFLL